MWEVFPKLHETSIFESSEKSLNMDFFWGVGGGDISFMELRLNYSFNEVANSNTLLTDIRF